MLEVETLKVHLENLKKFKLLGRTKDLSPLFLKIVGMFFKKSARVSINRGVNRDWN